ncbi:MAG: SH3 domain-containing protein [Bacteroidetes bacterium]|nr:SH3 domain-containing protein [Bacteroidota bacterium]
MVNIRAKPNTSSEIIHKAATGAWFEIIDKQDDWKLVKIESFVNGYIRQDMGSISNVLVSSTIRHRFDSFPWMRYVLIVGTLVILIIWINYLGRVGRKRKKVEIYYNINEEITKLYEKMKNFFPRLNS